MTRAIRRTALLLLASSAAFSQSTTAPPRFDAASIKPAGSANDPLKGPGEATVSFTPGNVTMRNVTLRNVLTAAYSVKDFQVSGPGLLDSGRYDLQAKAAPGTPESQLRQMLQQLLAERCSLALHRDSKDLAIRALLPGKSAPAIPQGAPDGQPAMTFTPSGLAFQNYSMAKLADYLTQHSPVPVVDQTGLAGTYNFEVKLLPAPSDNPVDVKRALGQGGRDGSLATMAAEQLGLKLESRKAPTEILVVERIEKPSGN